MAAQTVLVVGVPWNVPELTTFIRDAAAWDAQVAVVDTEESLTALDRRADCTRLPVAALTKQTVAELPAVAAAGCILSLTERRMILAAEVRELLGRPGTPAAAEERVSDKVLTRSTLRDARLTEVAFQAATLADLPAVVSTFALPAVVKPAALAGSTAVQYLAAPADVAAALAHYDPDVSARHGRDRLIVEDYIHGDEFSAEGLVVDGRLTLFTLTDKVNTGPPHFYETGHLMPSRHVEPWPARVRDYLQQVVSVLGIVTSPLHAELKISGDRFDLVEIHSRYGGGNIVRLLEECYGIRPFAAHLGALLGEDVENSPVPSAPSAVWGVGFFTGNVGVPLEWRSFAFPDPGSVVEIEFAARRGQKLEALEGVRLQHWRAGHVLFASDDRAAVLANVEFMRAVAGQARSTRR